MNNEQFLILHLHILELHSVRLFRIQYECVLSWLRGGQLASSQAGGPNELGMGWASGPPFEAFSPGRAGESFGVCA